MSKVKKYIIDEEFITNLLNCSKCKSFGCTVDPYASMSLEVCVKSGIIQPLTSAQQIADRALKALERLTWQSPIMSMLSMAEADLSTEIEDIVDRWKENK